jgi:hypothetical protein
MTVMNISTRKKIGGPMAASLSTFFASDTRHRAARDQTERRQFHVRRELQCRVADAGRRELPLGDLVVEGRSASPASRRGNRLGVISTFFFLRSLSSGTVLPARRALLAFSR